jgi:hypothetical protein
MRPFLLYDLFNDQNSWEEWKDYLAQSWLQTFHSQQEKWARSNTYKIVVMEVTKKNSKET